MAIGNRVERLEKAVRTDLDDFHVFLFAPDEGEDKENTARQKMKDYIRTREQYPSHSYMVIDMCNAHREYVKRLAQEGDRRELERLVALGIISKKDWPGAEEKEAAE